MRYVIRTEIATEVDDCDADLMETKWYAVDSNGRTYAKGGGSQAPHLHRLIGERIHGGALGKLVVDHMNGDTLDNRRANLRIVAHAENIRNRTKLNKNNTTGHMGVYADKERGGWKAQITLPQPSGFKQRYIHLGRFDTIEEAVAARLAAEEKHWGIQPGRAAAHDLSPSLASTRVRW